VFVDPEATYFGEGYYAVPHTMAIVDSAIVDNAAALAGGGTHATIGEAGVVVDGTTVLENAATVGAGIHLRALEGTSGTATVQSSAILRNVAGDRGGGAQLEDDVVMHVVDADRGDGPTDNAPDDLVLPAVTYAGYTAAETFTCDSVACDPAP
jgi:hypothetical protein